MKTDISAEYVAEIIDKYVMGFRAERNRAILKRRLIDGVPFEPLAEEFNLCVRQTKTIVYKYQREVLKHL